MLLQVEALEVKELYLALAGGSQAVLTVSNLCQTLRRLRLPCSPEDGWEWVQAVNAEHSGEIKYAAFDAFVREGMASVVGIDSAWQPRVRMSRLLLPRTRGADGNGDDGGGIGDGDDGGEEALAEDDIDAAGVSESALLSDCARLIASRDADATRLEEQLAADQADLIAEYEDEDEALHGPNPRTSPSGALVFDLSRLNLPSSIEFHGTPDFLPEVGSGRYSGKQYFRLHRLAYFFVRPVRLDSGIPQEQGGDDEHVATEEESGGGGESGAISFGKDGPTQAVGAVGDLAKDAEMVPNLQQSPDSNVAVATASTLIEVPNGHAREGVDTLDLRQQLRAPLRCYSVTLFMRCSGRPGMSYPLFTVLQSDEGDVRPGALCLETNLRLGDNLTSADSRNEIADSDMFITPGAWELITATVDCEYGKMCVYINGEQLVDIVDPDVFCRNGSFQLDAQRGLKFFAQSEMYSVQLSLREIQLAPSALTFAEVRALHASHGTWLCLQCDKLVGPSRSRCSACFNTRPKSAEPQPLNRKTNVQEIVASNLADTVLKPCVADGACALLFYSRAQHPAADKLHREWARLGQLCLGSDVSVCTFDVDHNELDERLLGKRTVEMLRPKELPSIASRQASTGSPHSVNDERMLEDACANFSPERTTTFPLVYSV
eukprot:6172570-Pleurochrysis_carterae.AAC.3